MKKTPWDCHKHKDELKVSDHSTVYHPYRGQLCYAERQYDAFLFHPVVFTDKQAAWKWIESGTIADIQESLGCLGVGFVKECLKVRTY